jgi:hypothetical protein
MTTQPQGHNNNRSRLHENHSSSSSDTSVLSNKRNLDDADILKLGNKGMSGERKLACWKNVRDSTLTRIQPSSIHGVGVFAIQNIPKDTQLFLVNHDANHNSRSSSATTIEYPAAYIEKLPEEVKGVVKDFILPMNKNGDPTGDIVYDIPESGLNSLDASFYLNR